ncbi:MAG: EAL domain-containing response regulator [Vicinamibacteria bacterium]
MSIADLRFMAVEDHEFQRGILLKALSALGATAVSEARDGGAALKLLEAPGAAFDIIISDLDMPGMDGMEFMRHLSEAHAQASIILTSVHERSLLASVEAMTKAYGVRVLGVVEKPVTSAKLEALIDLYAEPRWVAVDEGYRGPFTLEEILRGLRNDEFEPFFQPKVEVRTGRLRGAEALARWRHPQRGIVLPGAFVDPLEDSGQIDELTWIMLKKSAAMCRERRAATGIAITVSVNVSTTSLSDVDLASRVTEVVSGENLSPADMVIEVTESATTSEVAKALENLSRLRMKGFGLSIDDYGTGYASMQQLSRIAFTEMKIDHSFVTNAARRQSARVILQSSLDMARKLRMTSVAEGVETQEDWDLLRQLGCELAQGYFIARPMDAAAFMKWTEAVPAQSARPLVQGPARPSP